ncbi:MAG: hypothetical protein JOY71_10135 [Acetobacteraceae bacterium]|nr:hypothetical protein [Acetobacteraceae bacterium]MBV8522462.1 hypothetical protein [Acetobacteraceae bacterium]
MQMQRWEFRLEWMVDGSYSFQDFALYPDAEAGRARLREEGREATIRPVLVLHPEPAE